MGWTKGQTRIEDGIFVEALLVNLQSEGMSFRKMAKILNISDRQVRRIALNKQRISLSQINYLLDKIFPGIWSKQPRLNDSEIGPTTWVAGVGQATIRAATKGHW